MTMIGKILIFKPGCIADHLENFYRYSSQAWRPSLSTLGMKSSCRVQENVYPHTQLFRAVVYKADTQQRGLGNRTLSCENHTFFCQRQNIP